MTSEQRTHQWLNTALGGIVLASVSSDLMVGLAGVVMAVVSVGQAVKLRRADPSDTADTYSRSRVSYRYFLTILNPIISSGEPTQASTSYARTAFLPDS